MTIFIKNFLILYEAVKKENFNVKLVLNCRRSIAYLNILNKENRIECIQFIIFYFSYIQIKLIWIEDNN